MPEGPGSTLCASYIQSIPTTPKKVADSKAQTYESAMETAFKTGIGSMRSRGSVSAGGQNERAPETNYLVFSRRATSRVMTAKTAIESTLRE